MLHFGTESFLNSDCMHIPLFLGITRVQACLGAESQNRQKESLSGLQLGNLDTLPKVKFTETYIGKGILGDIVGLVLRDGRCSSVFLLGQVVDAVGLWVGDSAEWELVDGGVVGRQEQEGECGEAEGPGAGR